MGHDDAALSWTFAPSDCAEEDDVIEAVDVIETMDVISIEVAVAGRMSPVVHRARASTASSPAHRRAGDSRTRVLAMARDASPRRPSGFAIP
ncbi:hypothetical protein [Streptomyces sp. TRM68367]|uniref:hypothetical protein n=1 Tax=Streptomyces sp. TRM68367 TaxID=2758415 RepID=UPI00165BEA9C|nr:hypothetical protein [Streptomyces sp. TRM68367]MBC9723924.1 hypothetical protein [Streptomyces sp. TRM68367]